MANGEKQTPVEVDVDALRKLEDQSEPAIAKDRRSPQQDPGAPGGTGGTGGTTHQQDD